VVVGNADMAVNSLSNPEEVRDYLQEVQEAANRAAGLVRELVSFSRNRPVRREPLEFNQLVRESIGLLQRLLGHRTEIELALSPNPLPLMGDRSGLEQILWNLATNARDAMPEGGRIRVVTAALEGGRTVELAFSDSGTGMDETTRSQIFNPFYTTKGNYGSGLGLAIVYSMVDRHHGWIEVDSEPGQGTTFRIRLPGTEAPPPPTGPDPAVPGRILLLEDHAALRRLAELALTDAGYAVMSATNFEQARQLFFEQSAAFQLFLGDLDLGHPALLRLIQDLKGANPDLHVLLISGTGEVEGFPVLPKPFGLDDLLASIGQALCAC
jgi:CheY-like chemotaxis protein